jgi:teichuronic acid exporter
MLDRLRNKTLIALLWSFFERIGQNGIQFIIAVVLARLLAPAEFGLIAMLAIFMVVAQSFIDSGFGSALIQQRNVSHIDECSIFYFNIVVSIIAAGILCIIAPWIASFYNSPLLVLLTRALSLNLVINAFGLIQISLLTKHIDFKTQLKVSLLSTFFSGMIGIVMAYDGFGVWSLVAQSLSQNLFRTCLLWFIISWRPSWAFSFQSLRTLFAFGSKLLFSGLLDTIFQNIYFAIIGKFFSPADLGFYARAQGVQQLPVQIITESVSRVTYPVFSSIQEDKLRLKTGVRKALTSMAMLNFPVMIGLAVVAEPLIRVLLTNKWLPCVQYLQILCVVGMLYPLHAINLNVLSAQGRSDLFFKLEVLKKILIVVAIAITYRWGIATMIVGQVVTSIIAFYINGYYTSKLLDYSISQQIKDVTPLLLISSIMGGAIYGLRFARISNDYTLLIMQIMLGAVLYIGLCLLIRIPAFLEILGMIKTRLPTTGRVI